MEMLIFALALCAALFAAGLLGLLFAVKPIRPEPNARLTPREALVKWEAAPPARPGVCLLRFAPLFAALKQGERALVRTALTRPLKGWERRFAEEAPLLKRGLCRLRRNRGALSGEPLCEGLPKLLLLCRLALRSSARAAGAGALEGSSFLRALAQRQGSPAFAYARTVALMQLTLTPPEAGEEELWLRRLSELTALFGGGRTRAPWQEGGFYAFREPDAAACILTREGGILIHRTGLYLTLAGRRIHLRLPLTPRAATRTRISFDCGRVRMAAELFAGGLWLEYPPAGGEEVARVLLRPLLYALRLPHAGWIRRREGSFLAAARSAEERKRLWALCRGGRLLSPLCSEFPAFGKRLSHLLDNMTRPRVWKQEQLLLLLGRLKGMRGEELYRDARFCLLTADSHLTAAELEKAADLTRLLNRFGLRFFLLIAGRKEDLPPLSEAARAKLRGAGAGLISPEHPGLPVLAAQADLVCRGGKYRFQTPGEEPVPEAVRPELPLSTTLDGRFSLEEILACLTCPPGADGERAGLFLAGPRDREGVRREVLSLFAHQTLDGSVCRAFTAHTAVAGDRASTLHAVLAALFYTRFFTDDLWEERLPYLECPADFGVSAPSAISDSLRYHVCNALQFLLTAGRGEGEAAFLDLMTGLAVRRVLPELPEGCVKNQLKAELERLPKEPDTPLSAAVRDLLAGPPEEAHFRGLAALRALKGARKRLFAAVLLRHFYDRVLGLRFHRNMVQIRPPRPLPDFGCRIGGFCCEVRQGERGIRLNDVFFTDLGFVSLDAPAVPVIFY